MTKTISLLCLLLTGCMAAATPAPANPAPIPTHAPTPTPAAAPAKPDACATITAGALHVRYEPDEHSQAIGWVTVGTVVKILEPGSWPKIHGYGIDDRGRRARMTGYVNPNYITETECNP